MTGQKNILSYITQKKKTYDTALDYFQKTGNVFNQYGMIEKEEQERMKKRARENKGNIWHGFISLNEENSYKINTQEKCIAFIQSTFQTFFKTAHLDEKNIDLMCALHTDRPHHLHIHFLFWEKEAKYKKADGQFHYRSKGKIDKKAIDNMFVRCGIYISDDKKEIYPSRDEAIFSLSKITSIENAMHSNEEIQHEIIQLAKALPPTGRISYNSKDMQPYKKQIDKIVKMLLENDKVARKADQRFYQALEQRKKLIQQICNQPFVHSNAVVSEQEMEKQQIKYHYTIDEKNITLIQDIEKDYQRRQGNLVLKLAKAIQPEYYERKKGKQYCVNDTQLKKSLQISKKKIHHLYQQFLFSFGNESELLERDFTNRLKEIEEEMKQEKEKEQEVNYHY